MMYVSTPDTPDIARSLQVIEYNSNLLIVLLIVGFAFACIWLMLRTLSKYFNTL